MTSASGTGAEVRVLAPGAAGGTAIVLAEPLSLWGGLDPTSGEVIDPRHPQVGTRVAGKVVAMPSGRGSSSSSSVLAEAIRGGAAPAGFVLRDADAILALGSIVAAELYGREVPVVVASAALYERLRSGSTVTIDAPGGARPGRLIVS